MTACVRGCLAYRRHLKSCPVPDRKLGAWIAAQLDDQQRDQLMDGDRALANNKPRSHIWIGRYGGLETWTECRGCQPRDAEHGHLCTPCHERVTEWLDSLEWLHRWLSENITPGNAAGAKQDWQRPATEDGVPAPLRVAVLDVRNLLTDRVLELEDCARDVFDRPTRTGPFSLRAAVAFLRAWLRRIEDDPDLVDHTVDLLEDLFRRARHIVPWEDRPRRIAGILCPTCERNTLEVKPGQEDVTCRRCNAVITKTRYSIWTRILADEASTSMSSAG